MRDDAVYLRHVAECIHRIEDNVAGGKARFLASHTVQDATLRNLQTMSEATQRLSDAAKLTQLEVEWSKISAFRNVLVPNYLGIDLELIWKVIEDDLPELERAVEEMLQNITESDE